MKHIYLDYAASTPVDPRVLAAMEPYFVEKYGNPGSLHSFGQEAMAAVDRSRETIAKVIGAGFREIIFTGSATEANNLALRGALKAIMQNVKIKNKNDNLKFKVNSPQANTKILHFDFCTLNFRPRIITSSIEHESVLETCRDLEKFGVEVVYLPVDRRGIIDLRAFKKALNGRTVLVSVMYANNEIGTIQPLFEIKKIIDDFKKRNFQKKTAYRLPPTTYPLFHTDAAQAFQFLNCNVNDLGVDLMTLSAHKIYGPKGVGALYIRSTKFETRNPKQIPSTNAQNSKRLEFGNFDLDIVSNLGFRNSKLPVMSPLITGGGQEFGLRSGTENTTLIVGFTKATELISGRARLPAGRQELENKRIAGLRDYFWRELKKIYPKAEINGTATRKTRISSELSEKKHSGHSDVFVDSGRLPNILNVYFPDHEAQFLLTKLDLAGVAASSGSACRSRALQSSYVVEALGYPKERGKRSIRFSFGRPTTKAEIQQALVTIKRLL